MSDATPYKCNWGSNLEVCAFAKEKDRNVAVYSNNSTDVTQLSSFKTMLELFVSCTTVEVTINC